jgi:hypothetical protein
MGHKTRWQARFEGMDGETQPEAERRIRNIRRAREARSEVEAEDRRIERVLGLRVR